MKKIILAILLISLCEILSYAQHNGLKDITTFLDIPIDGNKKDLWNKIKEKRYKQTKFGNTKSLKGRFNGKDVFITIDTNGDKVWRVIVVDGVSYNKNSIATHFNNLCYHFQDSPKYLSSENGHQTIPDGEDIDYEMKYNNKRYEAIYFQRPNKEMEDSLVNKPAFGDLRPMVINGELDSLPEDKRNDIITDAYYKRYLEIASKKLVWFKIQEFGTGEYRIAIYYENVYNDGANGEDL